MMTYERMNQKQSKGYSVWKKNKQKEENEKIQEEKPVKR